MALGASCSTVRLQQCPRRVPPEVTAADEPQGKFQISPPGSPVCGRGTNVQTLSGLSSAQKAERRQRTGRPGAPSTAALHTPPAIERALTRADSCVRLDRPLGVCVQPARKQYEGILGVCRLSDENRLGLLSNFLTPPVVNRTVTTLYG